MADENRPPLTFRFSVEMEGEAVPDVVHVSGLESRLDVVEYRDGLQPDRGARKLAGRVHYRNVVLRYGLGRQDPLHDRHRAWVRSGAGADRRKVVIRLLDSAGDPLRAGILLNAWPAVREGPVLNAGGSDAAIQTIEPAHEGIDVAG